MKKKTIIMLLALSAVLCGCKTQDVPGRRRTPRGCNTCTKWSQAAPELVPAKPFATHEA